MIAASTTITTNTGTAPVTTMKSGTSVRSNDDSLQPVACVTQRTYSGPLMQLTSKDDDLWVTPEQPVLTASGWASADELRQGTILHDGELIHDVTSHDVQLIDVYDVQIVGARPYMAGRFVLYGG